MINNDIKLIISDIDGTLLNNNKQINDETLKYLLALQEQGYTFALCSGRIPSEQQEFAKQLQLEKYGGYIIHTNGAGIINCKTKEEYNFSPLEVEELHALIRDARKYKLYTIVQYNDSYIVEINLFLDFIRRFIKNKLPNKRYFKNHITLTQFQHMSRFGYSVQDAIFFLTKPVNKICFRGNTHKLDQFALYLSKYQDKYNLFRITKHSLEINHASVSKGTGIQNLCKLLNININQVLAFGDSANDHEMLYIVPNSVAMGNADEETKNIAKYVTDTNENDGIIQFIKNYIS